jgi:hypothetical protein
MVDNHPIIGGCLLAVEMLIRQVSRTVQPGTDDAPGLAAAELVDSCIHDMRDSFQDKIGEIIAGELPWGWQLHELWYKRRNGIDSNSSDGLIGWADWPVRAQESLLKWDLDNNDGIRGMWQLGPPDYIPHYLPVQEKCLLFRTTLRRGSPQGRPFIRNAYIPYRYQKNIAALEAIGIERDLVGLAKALIPSEVILADPNSPDPEQRQMAAIYEEFKAIVVNTRRGEQEGIVLPSDRDENGNLIYDMELISSPGQRQFDMDSIIGRYDQRIAISMLSGFILLGMENVGSNALGMTIADLFTTAITAFIDGIFGVINTRAVPKLLYYNGFPPSVLEKPPVLTHGRLERTDLAALGTFLQMLSFANGRGAGIQLDTRMDGPLAKALMDIAGLPQPPDPKDVMADLELVAQNQAFQQNQVGTPDISRGAAPAEQNGNGANPQRPNPNDTRPIAPARGGRTNPNDTRP